MAAKTGMPFFVKWLTCLVLGVISKDALFLLYLASGFRDNFLWRAIPVLIQVWCIFGFRWRTWVWIAVDWTTLWWIAYVWRGGAGALMTIALGIVIKTLLLFGVRRNLGAGLIALTVFHFMESAAFWGSLFRAFGAWLKQLQLGWAGSLWANFQIQHSPQIVSALIFGAVLAWLMPPVDQPKKQEAAPSAPSRDSDSY